MAGQLGYFKEEEKEIETRRSARLRGLQPEFEGLESTKRTRSPRKTREIEAEANISISSLEELMKPRQKTYLTTVFEYFGFYDEAEIQRRRSLRLQGLDPEFEGLTWGHRYLIIYLFFKVIFILIF